MRTIWSILILVVVVGLGIWLFTRGPSNPGIPTTGEYNSTNATSTTNGTYDGNNSSSTDNSSLDNSGSEGYNTKG